MTPEVTPQVVPEVTRDVSQEAIREQPARPVLDWPSPQRTSPRARVQRAVCPTCSRWTRIGYSAASPVVGQHYLGCCPCPGSYAPVNAEEAVDHTDARAVGHLITGVLPAIPHPRQETP